VGNAQPSEGERERHRQEAQDVMGNGGAGKNIKVKEAEIS